MSDEITSGADESKWAGGVHIGALAIALLTAWAAGFGGMLAAIIVWLIKKDESPFIRRHAAEAFNFNLSMFIYTLIFYAFVVFTGVSALLTLGLALLVTLPLALLAVLAAFILCIVWVWCTIQAAIAGFDGKDYRYPLTFRIMS
jgi:uncharacterized Tic20 family protein